MQLHRDVARADCRRRPRAATGHLLVALVLAFGLVAASAWSGGLVVRPVAAADPVGAVKYYQVQASYQGSAERLWDIAQRLLGDGDRYIEIYALNQGRRQPDGGQLSDPTVLNPGWLLVLPWDAVGDGVVFDLLPDPAAGVPATPPVPRPTSTRTATPKPSTTTTPPLAAVPVPGCAAAAQNTLAKIPWAQLRLAPDQAWPLSRGRGVTVAIVDSGVDATAPALAGRVSTGVDVPAGKGQGNTDCLGHGTAMAGIIVAQPRPGSGFVGIAPEATIMPIRVDLARGAPNPAQVATAFQVAVSAGASVIAVPGPLDLSDPVVGKAADDAVAHNVVLVVAGDPTGRNLTAKPGVLRVGAVAADDRLTAMYPPGSVDVLAPGDGVVSLSANGSGEIEGSGTDFAVPFVAGLAALVRSASPQLSAQITTGHIESTADRRSGTSPDPAYGWGVINLTAAVNASLRDDAASAGGKINVGGLGTPATLAILLACALVVAGVGWQLRRVVVRRRGHDGPSSGTAG